MKLNNFTSLDPDEHARGIKGLTGASALDRKVWNEFHARPQIVEDSEALWENRVETREPIDATIPIAPEGPTEGVVVRRTRLGQRYFRRVVLSNFDYRCALTGIAQLDLLTASHISPWAEDEPNRLNPANSLCLNKLHDAAFDRQLITFDDNLRLVVGRRLRNEVGTGPLADAILHYEGCSLSVPIRRAIASPLLKLHRSAFEAAER